MRLQNIRTAAGMYALLDLSPSDLAPDLARELHQTLAPTSSGVVLNPFTTFEYLATQPATSGTVFALHDSVALAEAATTGHVPLLADWGVEAVAHTYSLAWLSLWYHPAEAQALVKKQFVAELSDYCRYQGIDFVLELRVSDQSRGEQSLGEVQLASLQELGRFASAVVISFPGDSLTCATLTAELDVPWLIRLGGTYDVAKDEVRTALENGARGFMGAEVLWDGVGELPRDADGNVVQDALTQFVTTTVRDRFLELARITDEMGKTVGLAF